MSGYHRQRVLGLPLRLTVIYAIVFAVALLVYAAVWTDAPLVATDTQGYLEFARDLADGTIDDFHARTPGFPVLLLLTGSTEEPRRSLFYLSLVLHCVSVLLLAWLLDKAGLPVTAIVCFGLLAMTPLFLQTAGWALSEGLTQFLLVCGISALVAAIQKLSVPLVLIAGLAFAGATLTRPLYQCVFLPLALLVWLCGRTKAHRTGRSIFRIAGVFVLAFLMPVLAYCGFNLSRFGYFGVTYWLGHNLSTRTARIVQLLPDEYAETRSILTAVRDAQLVRDPTPGSHSVHWYANHALTELEATTGLRDVALADYMLGLNLRLIRDHPLSYLREVAESFAGYWFPSVTRLARGPRIVVLIELLVHFLIVGMFFVQTAIVVGYCMSRGAICSGEGRGAPWDAAKDRGIFAPLYVGAMAIIVYTAIVSCMVDTGEARQRTPTDLLILLVVFLGGNLWLEARKREPDDKQVGAKRTRSIELASDPAAEVCLEKTTSRF